MKTRQAALICRILAAILMVAGSTKVSVAVAGYAAPAVSSRTVTDLQGNQVHLPPAKDLQRVVIIAPTLVSLFASLGLSRAQIVGANKMAFENANEKLLDLMLPGWRDIPTGFLTGFRSNTEELLTLNPDIILVYGNFQKKGLQGITVPVLDFYLNGHNNETGSTASETLLRQVFGAGNGGSSLAEEWAWSKKRTADILGGVPYPRKKGLMIVSNTGDKLIVMGKGSCGDDWLKKSGLVNVADVADPQGGGREVCLEQIYAWDPDIIYIFWGIPASKYRKERIPGQNWHHVKAVRNNTVYDMPRGLTNWGTAKADSPLTLLWLVSKNYPHLLKEADFLSMMKAYYSRRYNIDLSDELMEEILYPHGK